MTDIEQQMVALIHDILDLYGETEYGVNCGTVHSIVRIHGHHIDNLKEDAKVLLNKLENKNEQ